MTALITDLGVERGLLDDMLDNVVVDPLARSEGLSRLTALHCGACASTW